MTGGLVDHSAVRRVMVALDYPTADGAMAVVRRLEGIPCWFKVGMELFYAEGPRLVALLKDAGHSVFLDLKLHDIPNTVRGASASIARLGVDMFNVHAAGGLRMMEAAREGAESAAGAGAGAGGKPLVIAVTQLTSTSREMMNDEIGVPGSVEDAVLRYAELAARAGLDGAVASAHEVPAIKARLGASFLTVTPGIRPAGADIGDQRRIMTPAEALRQGTDYMVIGRPITQASDPRAALLAVTAELS